MPFSVETLEGYQISPDGDSMEGIFNYLKINNFNPFTNNILRIGSSSLNNGNQKSLEELIIYNYNSYVQTSLFDDSNSSKNYLPTKGDRIKCITGNL